MNYPVLLCRLCVDLRIHDSHRMRMRRALEANSIEQPQIIKRASRGFKKFNLLPPHKALSIASASSGKLIVKLAKLWAKPCCRYLNWQVVKLKLITARDPMAAILNLNYLNLFPIGEWLSGLYLFWGFFGRPLRHRFSNKNPKCWCGFRARLAKNAPRRTTKAEPQQKSFFRYQLKKSKFFSLSLVGW